VNLWIDAVERGESPRCEQERLGPAEDRLDMSNSSGLRRESASISGYLSERHLE
jgi:hypothetical protein